MEYCNYSWDATRTGVSWLNARIVESKIDYKLVIGLSRGGLIPAVMLSHSLDIPFKALEWSFRDSNVQNEASLVHIMNWYDPTKKILIVDDICDSGQTLTSLLAFLNKRFYNYAGFDTAVLINNVAQPLKPTYNAKLIDRSHDKRWVNFCWEKAPRKA